MEHQVAWGLPVPGKQTARGPNGRLEKARDLGGREK
jgi:hypothetical protein